MNQGPHGLAGGALCFGWRGVGLALLGLASALLLVWGSAPGGGTARQLAAVLAAAGIGGAALVWITLQRRFEHMPVAAILGLALLLRLVAVQASPLLEDDHYRYLWDGFQTAITFDPYRWPPSAFFGDHRLPPQWQHILSGINNPDVPTIYGPVLQALFALAHLIAPGRLEALQALLLAVDMAVLAVLVHQGLGRRWLLAYAIHPLVLKEAMASAHPDALVALWLLLALVAWRHRRAGWVGVMLGLAVGTKVAALVALPLLLWAPAGLRSGSSPPPINPRWVVAVGAGVAASLAVLYLPFWLSGGSDLAALRIFGSQWRFNPLLYRVIEAVLPGPAARPVAALLIVAGVALIAWRWRQHAHREGAAALPPLDLALMALVLLSPVVNPWYGLWLLPLSLRMGRGSAAAIGVAASLSYLNSSVLAEAGLWGAADAAAPYAVPWPLALVQIAIVGIAAHIDRSRADGPGAHARAAA